MSEEKCLSCGNTDFAIVRDMTSRRVCKCGESWMPPTREHQLQAENTKLKAREQKLLEVISVLKEACGFYSSKDSWISFGHLKKERIDKSDCEILEQVSGNGLEIDYQFSCGGRRARLALAKVDEMLKEIGVGK